MKKLYIVPVLLAFLLAGCEKHVTLIPTSQITKESFFKTENDVQSAVNGMYVRTRELINSAAFDLYIWGEGRSEVFTNSFAGDLGYPKFYNNTLTSANPGPTWEATYRAINAANLLIKYTPGIAFVSADAKKDALAQAYTTRAFLYFVLARTYGGVPLRIEPTEGFDPIAIQLPKSSEAEVFALIKKDLDAAIALYPTNTIVAGKGKWSKPGANALKGDVYLWTGKRLNGGNADFTTALNALNDVTAAPGVALEPNYADVFRYTNKGNKEILMAIKFSTTEGGSHVFALNMYSSTASYPTYVPASQIAIVGTPAPGGNGNVWRITPAVRSQFANNDTRKAATFVDLMGTAANEYYTTYGLKYNGTVENGTRLFTSDFILYRLGDILLLKAEAKVALSQDPGAEINAIRLRAYGSGYTPFVSGTPQQNNDAVLKERLLELTLEGKRWWDLVRFGKAFDLVPSLQGKSAQTHLLYWPIGTSTIAREPLVTEIPGWQ